MLFSYKGYRLVSCFHHKSLILMMSENSEDSLKMGPDFSENEVQCILMKILKGKK